MSGGVKMTDGKQTDRGRVPYAAGGTIRFR